jgi:hypothetical protein
MSTSSTQKRKFKIRPARIPIWPYLRCQRRGAGASDVAVRRNIAPDGILASMRPRRGRLGWKETHLPTAGRVRASMSPRRARLGCLAPYKCLCSKGNLAAPSSDNRRNPAGRSGAGSADISTMSKNDVKEPRQTRYPKARACFNEAEAGNASDAATIRSACCCAAMPLH